MTLNLTQTETRIVNLCDFFLKKGFLVFIFLFPLFFLPFTLEFYEFNKLYLFYFFTSFFALTWVLKMVVAKQIIIKRTVLDVPLFLLILSFLVSTVLSNNKTYSIYGNYLGMERSLVTVLFLYVFYYIVVSNIDTKHLNFAIKTFIFSTVFASLIFLFTLLNLDVAKMPFFTVPGVTPLGDVSTSTFIFALSAVLSLSIYLKTRIKQGGLFFLFIYVLLGVSSIASFELHSIATLLVGSVIALFLESSFSKAKLSLLGVSFLVILGAGILFSPLLSQKFSNFTGVNLSFQRQIVTPLNASWNVSSSVIGVKPFWGFGPNTFYTSWTSFKPAYVNNNPDSWNTRFPRASNFFITVAGELGIFGILALVLFLLKAIKGSLRNHNGLVVLAFLVGASFFPLNFTLVLTFIVFASLAFLGKDEKKFEKVIESPAYYSLPAVLLVVLLVVLFFGQKFYRADVAFRSSLNDFAKGGTKTYMYQARAVSLNPQSDLYRRYFAQSSLMLANAISQKTEVTDSDKTQIQSLVPQAIREARIASELLGPLNVENWEMLAGIYRSLNTAAEDALGLAEQAYNKAISLDPTSPRLRVDLGGVYYIAKSYQAAGNAFATAVQLKNDYANAHYNLAKALFELKDYANAKTEYEIVLRLVPESSEDAKRVNEELTALLPLLEASKQAEVKPTVDQLENQALPQVPQEELTAPEEPVIPEIPVEGATPPEGTTPPEEPTPPGETTPPEEPV